MIQLSSKLLKDEAAQNAYIYNTFFYIFTNLHFHAL